jgi:ABC-type bacteriocin/lantibiotic exporter with double-glycine peptidase domain
MANITHTVNHQQQTRENSCWAASAAMLTGTSESVILEKFADFGDDGASEPECQRLATELGLTVLPEMCRTPEGWWEILERGPVMVGIPRHFIVVSAIDYNEDTGAYYVLVNDPGNSGPDWRLLGTVEQGYEDDWKYGWDLLQN